jgi:hypothetical protein
MQNEIEKLFIRTLDDLQNKISSNDDYEILHISALLRKLLLDGEPLIHQVNRRYQKKITFHIGLPLELNQTNYQNWSIQDGFDPDTGRPGRPTDNVSVEGLLSAKVLKINDVLFTVVDLLKYEAHIKGGVHAGKPDNDKQGILVFYENNTLINGIRMSLNQLKSIGRVVLKGLLALRDAVEENK